MQDFRPYQRMSISLTSETMLEPVCLSIASPVVSPALQLHLRPGKSGIERHMALAVCVRFEQIVRRKSWA